MIGKITKSSSKLSLKDRLSRLTITDAKKLCGVHGEKLIIAGGAYEIDIDEQVVFQDDYFSLKLPDGIVTISVSPKTRFALGWTCTCGEQTCVHFGAALSLVLEDKMALGLAAAPVERVPVESLDQEALFRQAIQDRQDRAKTEKMVLRSVEPEVPWTDYTITSAASGKTYQLGLRGVERGDSYCSCPDFRRNTLGTCKHIMHALNKVRQRFPARVIKQPYVQKELALHLRYDAEMELRLLVPDSLSPEVAQLVRPLARGPITNIQNLIQKIQKIESAGTPVRIFPDAEEFIQRALFRQKIQSRIEQIRSNPKDHPLRKTLLKTELLPYQIDGIAFAVGAGRAVLADDMGLGKTIQGIGTAELFAREVGIRKVLIVCPASLKSQWLIEIRRFSDRTCQLIMGSARDRHAQYACDSFFIVCNYEQVLRDINAIENVSWDLIILDEAQRIKNWEARTSRIIKALRSEFALVLSGTPLENRLEELFSVVEFIDNRWLGPAFQFFNQHRTVDEKGKVLGYKNLDVLRERLKPVLLRRTRAMVMRELPPRSSEVIRIPPTDEQLELHAGHKRVVSTILKKRFISEMDLLRLQKALLMCRMAADSTALVDKQFPGFSSKLEKLEELLGDLAQETDRKIVLFSEWTTMLDMIGEILERLKLPFVRLDGSVPQKERQRLVHRFQTDPDCKLFITTNAGSTGLNLQAANTVINIDLPWNPAILEQRISRAHRMGQKRPVQVYILVTEGTLEENLLTTLSAKHELALAVLDPNSEATSVDLASGIEELKRRMEVLLGAMPDAPVDESMKMAAETRADAGVAERKERMASLGGQMLSSAFAFLKELMPAEAETEVSRQAAAVLKQQFEKCVDRDENGKIKLTVTLPDLSALDPLAETLARLMNMSGAGEKCPPQE
jgi:superfamily II DNA or RNA helicase